MIITVLFTLINKFNRIKFKIVPFHEPLKASRDTCIIFHYS